MAELQIPSDSSLPALVYSGFNISLDHVATLSDHGIALRDAVIAANVPTLHRTKIAGLFLVYHTITRLGFFRQNTVQWPPRQGPAFNTSHWRDVGFNEDVIQILCFLFYLGPIQTDWEFGRGEQMAPSSPFCNYYNTTDPDKRDPSYQHKDEIPLWAFRFTEGWDEEKNYVYDSRDGTIAIWDMEFYNPDFDYPAKQPSFPAAEIFAIWLLQMYDLTYVPYLTE